MRRWIAWILVWMMICLVPVRAVHAELTLSSPSTILIEASTGQVVYEQNADEIRSPASITKIMTLLLIYEALEKGSLHLEDMVTVSAHAKSMGGSQVFLEEGEQQNVETMIKCIVIASGNDASVAMAEHLAGSEQEFVDRMNQRAGELGMKNTHFIDCCGLSDSKDHYTTASDVAVMSRMLITAHPQILTYSSIWMEDIVHVTKKGSSPFTLSNTNKLIRSYEGCLGLKTGSTSVAKYCVSAVAMRNDITLIAVVMGAPDHKVRFADAASMLNYGFGTCRLYKDENQKLTEQVQVSGGVTHQVGVQMQEQFHFLDTSGKDLSKIQRKLELEDQIKAPVKKGTKIGEAVYTLDGGKIGSAALVASENIKKAGFLDCIGMVWKKLLFSNASQI
ncbi:MAG: D-alanyl-D-alanine carboxypeptidase [Lachnospiraceae bacterium]|nr:D-alanyl-D-alanine carboxypeptidase [Lachnospiraceae bacterium]